MWRSGEQDGVSRAREEGGTKGSFIMSPAWLSNMRMTITLLKKCPSTYNKKAALLLWVFNGNYDFHMV